MSTCSLTSLRGLRLAASDVTATLRRGQFVREVLTLDGVEPLGQKVRPVRAQLASLRQELEELQAAGDLLPVSFPDLLVTQELHFLQLVAGKLV